MSRNVFLVVLVVLVVLIVSLSGCGGYFSKSDATKAKDAEAEKVFKSNFDTWMNHPPMVNEAQLSLASEHERVIKQLVDEYFTSHDPAILSRIGRKIWDIGGEASIPIVLSFANDPRVVVAENVRLWYKHYNPKAILDKIEKNSSDITKEVKERVGLDGKLAKERTARLTAEKEFNRRLKDAEDTARNAKKSAEAAEKSAKEMKQKAEDSRKEATRLVEDAVGSVEMAQRIAGNFGVLSRTAERARNEASKKLADAERARNEAKGMENRAAEAQSNAVKLALAATTAADIASRERQNAEKRAERAHEEANRPTPCQQSDYIYNDCCSSRRCGR
jgi:predicted small lipoprotein YifL